MAFEPTRAALDLPAGPYQSDADATDERLVAMWLKNKRSIHTKRAYERTIARFAAFTHGKPLRYVTLWDLQTFSDSLDGAESSKMQTLAAVRSLLTFCAKLRAIPFNVGAALETPTIPKILAARILTEEQVAKMIALSTGRDHALVRLGYSSGCRVSELASLRWNAVNRKADGSAVLTIVGKGRKLRYVGIRAETVAVLDALRLRPDDDDEPVFAGRKPGTTLTASQAWRIVRDTAKLAGIQKPVSPHFLRHSHASHAVDRGASVVLIRDTLGHASVATTNAYFHAREGDSSSRFLAF